MTEAEIQAQLKQNVPQPQETFAAPVVDVPTTDQDHSTVDYQLDEITQYKLQDYFGEVYKENNEVNRQRVQFVYDEVAKRVEEKEYGFVVAKLRDLERMIGVSNSEDRLYKVYQWLKLDKARRNVEAEMGAITNG